MGSGEQILSLSDVSTKGGQEQKITSIPFKELVANLTKKYPQVLTREQREGRVNPDQELYFGLFLNEDEDYVPFLTAYFHPPLTAGRVNIVIQCWGVNNPQTRRIHSDKRNDVPLEKPPRKLVVYNASLSQLQDSAYLDELREVEAENIIVANSGNQSSKLGSWVVDPELRVKIDEYANAIGIVEKYQRLRFAATNKTSSPGLGHYTYDDVKKGVEERIFSKKDLQWLEAYMKNKGIPIVSG